MCDLLPNEQYASDYVAKIGIERAKRVLSMLSRRFDNRCRRAQGGCHYVTIFPESIHQTSLERELTQRLKLGLTINDTSNTAAAARMRNLARVQARNARRAARICANG